VRRLGQPVHHCENHLLAIHLGQGLDEIHGHILPDGRRYSQGLQ
jgi:hypothetical protein